MGAIIFKGGRAGVGEEGFSMSALHCAEARSNPSSVATPKFLQALPYSLKRIQAQWQAPLHPEPTAM